MHYLNLARRWKKRLASGIVLASITILLLQGCSSDSTPAVFSLIQPADGQSVKAGSVCLTFKQDSTQNLYNVYVGSSPDTMALKASGLATPFYAASDLKPATTYYWQVGVTNTAGVMSQGPIWTFTTATNGLTVNDIDGNTYKTVQIGNQVWMADNLKTTKYRNGTVIANVSDSTAWENDKTGAYSDFNNSEAKKSLYGLLYNWYAVNSTSGLCPAGWHVAKDEEWAALVSYLGGDKVAGGLLKEAGTTHWDAPNLAATNSSGFTALPGGWRESDGDFDMERVTAFFWSSTDISSHSTNFRGLGNRKSNVGRYTALKNQGFSVRCLAD